MGFTTLELRLKGTRPLPSVLAGPILRKATPKSVTVWFALRAAAKVLLTVKDEREIKVAEGNRDTVAIGKNLHIVAVTAKPLREELKEGIVYRYDVEFRFGDKIENLVTATAGADLGYPSKSLPSFALPPEDPTKLRLLQGSCRKPHGAGKDTLPLVDKLIAENPSAFGRPHQLLLTGDQIYADDVADSLLLMIMDAADALLGWKEEVSFPAFYGGPSTVLPPACTRTLLFFQSGFTSVDLRSHLISLGEYLCMYLFVWSDVLWPIEVNGSSSVATLPTFAQVVSVADAGVRPIEELIYKQIGRNQGSIESDTKSLAEFRKTLPEVRRALANVPSYMIFDDHEVTDDWNMTLDYSSALHDKPFGLRVTQNALAAYALCQHWGNVPEDFEPVWPGHAVLGFLDTPPSASFENKGSLYNQNSERIFSLLGLHKKGEIQKNKAVFHEPISLQYHFAVDGPGHQVIFTDTRTWRSFPKGGNEPSELLPKEHFQRQFGQGDDLRSRVLLVVLTTNAPAVQPIRTAARNPKIARSAGNFDSSQRNPDIYESWEIPSASFDRLLKAITDKLPVISGEHRGAAILLSGDVHHSFATRIIYRATNRFEDSTPTRATAVIAQLVASSFKKQTDGTIGFHREGYFYAPVKFITSPLITKAYTEGFVGWNLPDKSKANVGAKVLMDGDGDPLDGTRGTLTVVGPTTVALKEPFLNADSNIAMGLELTRRPDYRYRLDYLRPTGPGTTQLHPPDLDEFPAGTTHAERLEGIETFKLIGKFFRSYNATPNPVHVVGFNNFGEITFQRAPNASTPTTVRHTLRWWDPDMIGLRAATYTVRLDLNAPNDKEFKDLKARIEPIEP
jgi:hypothetical protein